MSQPTPGAQRAAEAIAKALAWPASSLLIDEMPLATIIDRETHLPELIAALAGAADCLTESAKQHRASGDSGHAFFCEVHARKARKALAACQP